MTAHRDYIKTAHRDYIKVESAVIDAYERLHQLDLVIEAVEQCEPQPLAERPEYYGTVMSTLQLVHRDLQAVKRDLDAVLAPAWYRPAAPGGAP